VPAALQRSASATGERFSFAENCRRRALSTTSGSAPIAPDEEVLQCVWHQNLTSKPYGVTRRQWGYYAVQGGLPDAYVKSTLGLDADADHKVLIGAIDDLSKFTHIEPETLDVPEVQIDRRAEEALAAVANVLRTVGECRDRLIRHLEEDIDAAAIDEVLGDPLVGIDELASHYSLEDVSISSVNVHQSGSGGADDGCG
jgi:hypothetical protein